MNPRTTLNAALVLAIFAIGAGLYLKSKSDADSVPGTFAILADAAENLQQIEIRRNRQAPIVLIRGKDDRQWRMQIPRTARLDELQLARVLDMARLRTSVRVRADDLARFELDQPWAQIRFNQQAVDFGSVNQVTQELYLRSGDYVFAVPQRFAGAVPGNVAKLLSHSLFAVDEHPVAFQFQHFSLRHDAGRWQLTPPNPKLSQDDLVRWADQWRLAISTVTQPGSATASVESIAIDLRNKPNVTVSVLARSPDLVLLRRDELLQYHLPARLAQVLLSPPSPANVSPH